jgi:hypothetical protein
MASFKFVNAYQIGKHSQKPDILSWWADHSKVEPSLHIMPPETQFKGFGAEITNLLLGQIKEALQDSPSLDAVMAAATNPDLVLHYSATKFRDYTLQDRLLLYQGARDQIDTTFPPL